MRCLRVLAVLFPSLFLALPGAYASGGREAKERAAKKACLTGDTAKGVDILADLYLDSNDPNFIFNQGRCYEQGHLYEDAVARFREFLVKAKNLSPHDKADTEKHIASCQSYLATKPLEPAPPAATVVTDPSGAQQGQQERAGGNSRTESVVSLRQTTVPGQAGSALRIAGTLTAAVGGAGLITGIILNAKVNSMSTDLEKPYGYSASTDSIRKDYKVLGWVSYSVAAACMVGGAGLYYFGWRKGQDSSLALVPTVGPGLAGLAITGAL